MKKIICIFLCLSIIGTGVKSQPGAAAYQQRVNEIDKNIHRYFYDSSNKLYYEAIPVEKNEKLHSYWAIMCFNTGHQ